MKFVLALIVLLVMTSLASAQYTQLAPQPVCQDQGHWVTKCWNVQYWDPNANMCQAWDPCRGWVTTYWGGWKTRTECRQEYHGPVFVPQPVTVTTVYPTF